MKQDYTKKIVDVDLITLDEYINDDTIDAVGINVEGHDFQVLQGNLFSQQKNYILQMEHLKLQLPLSLFVNLKLSFLNKQVNDAYAMV